MRRSRSLRVRFSTVFLLVLLVVMVLGAISIWRLTDYYTFSAELRDRHLRSTEYIGDLNNYTSDFRAAEATSLLVTSAEEVAANRNDVAELDRRIALAEQSYEYVPHDRVEVALYHRFHEAWSAYRATAGRVLELAAGDARGDGVRLYFGDSNLAYSKASDTLGELTDLNTAHFQTAALNSERGYRAARLFTTVALAFAVLTVVAGLLYMRRSIAEPLLRLAAVMRSLANNVTDGDIPGAGRTDEIGEMARAVRVFRDNSVELALSQRLLAGQASMLAEKLAAEQHLTQLQRNFLSMASHEFRTPLTVIDGQAQRLIATVDALDAGDIADRAAKIRGATLRITSVMDSLLNSSRLLDGQPELYFHPTAFDLAALLRDVCRLHREVVPAARINEEFPDAPLAMEGDPKLLFQAFSNLLGNAVKYSPDGEPVRIEARLRGGQARVRLSDRGIGIPDADRHRVFDRYFRGSNSKGIVGTGIGLFLVKTVIELHGGTVGVSSREGEGTQFTVRLPARVREVEARRAG